MKHGIGNINLPRQKSYSGKWKHDKMHGYGNLTQFGVGYYYGLMKDDELGSKGVMTCKDES